MNTVAVIMAGGGGTRFWPLSRQNKPKQLLNISGTNIMLNDTIHRYETLVPASNMIVVTNRSQVDLLKSKLLHKIPEDNILVEPISKNTSACILYAALHIQKKYGDSIMMVLPSDHHITEVDKCIGILDEACTIAKSTNKIVTIGIKPAFPATSYGYIKYDLKSIYSHSSEVFKVEQFVEKPDYDKAKGYIAASNYLWNSGMFIWKTSVIIENFIRYLPRLYRSMMHTYERLCSEKEQSAIDEVYPSLQNISIDYGILERSDSVVVIPGDFGWNDIGSWDALGTIFPPDKNGNIVKANHVEINTHNSIIYGNNRLIATIGIDDLIIAETEDALVVCPKNRAQDIKKIVDALKERGMNEYI